MISDLLLHCNNIHKELLGKTDVIGSGVCTTEDTQLLVNLLKILIDSGNNTYD